MAPVFEFIPACAVEESVGKIVRSSVDRNELMKINIKKTNPAFKLRQVLPHLPNLSGRAGVAKDVAKVAPSPNSAPRAAASTWVTTE